MPRLHFLHRDEMLLRTGHMPARKEGEKAESFEHRKGMAALQIKDQHGLRSYPIARKRAHRYRQDEVDELVKRIVDPQLVAA